ncbi:uncharacterized protein EDB91DRAFT_1335895 [Suillus paluster]|uniref:uncharacterized protein n=1 Tax=Suillus paluster TaxID=48578 RepID=UPI001B86BFE3|nr:uncharacterized protein EDB91DRAFT_1335895 [Suillus paluster]KAG1743276.1 hypothetical protein EDB91DRAFT_1335895 [Suillus paluster]
MKVYITIKFGQDLIFASLLFFLLLYPSLGVDVVGAGTGAGALNSALFPPAPPPPNYFRIFDHLASLFSDSHFLLSNPLLLAPFPPLPSRIFAIFTICRQSNPLMLAAIDVPLVIALRLSGTMLEFTAPSQSLLPQQLRQFATPAQKLLNKGNGIATEPPFNAFQLMEGVKPRMAAELHECFEYKGLNELWLAGKQDTKFQGKSRPRMNPQLANILMVDQKFSEDIRGALNVNCQHSKQQEVDVLQQCSPLNAAQSSRQEQVQPYMGGPHHCLNN